MFFCLLIEVAVGDLDSFDAHLRDIEEEFSDNVNLMQRRTSQRE